MQVKQEYLAAQLGLSQQAISQMEQRETIDAPTLEKIAGILKVPVDVIKSYDDEKMVMNIQNNFEGSNPSATNVGIAAYINQCTFNPLDKLMEVVDENKKLYECLLQAEREKVELLQQILKGNN